MDVDLGLYIGLGFSIFMIVFKDQMFQMRNLTSYKDSDNFVDAGLVLEVAVSIFLLL